MNTQYKNNLTAVMQASKKYTDDKIEQALELLEDYDLSSDTISQTSTSATAPSDVRTASLIQVGGNSVKYAPSSASDDTTANLKTIPENTYSANVDIIGNTTSKTSPSTTSDDSVSKIKSIPLSTFTLGLDYIGGASNVSENLLVLSDETRTPSGLTVVISNGKFTSSGTPSTTGWIFIKAFSLNAGTYYYKDMTSNASKVSIVDSNYQAKSTQPFTLTETTTLYLAVTGQSITDNGQLNNSMPMLVSGSTAPTEFKQGFDGIRSAKVSEIVVSGANKINPSDELAGYSIDSTTGAPISSIYNGCSNVFIKVEPNTQYTLSANKSILNLRLSEYSTNDASGHIKRTQSNSNVTSFTITTTANTHYVKWSLNYDNSTTITTALLNSLDLMLCEGSSTDYVPYQTPISRQIPAEIQANEYYGLGLSSSLYNSLNLISKKLNKKVYRVVLNKTDYTWQLNGNGTIRYVNNFANIIKKVALSTDTPSIMSDKLNTVIWQDMYDGNITSGVSISISGNLGISISDYETLTTLEVIFELATYEDIDMSSYLDDSFKTFTTNNQYTDIEMVNEYGYDMPNKVEYFGKIDNDYADSVVFSGNLINLQDVAETTKNGITYSAKDGVITLNGTATQSTTIDFICNSIGSGDYSICWFNDWLIAWDYLKVSLMYNASYVKQFAFSVINSSSTSVSATDGITKIRIYITGNPTFTNAHFKPMLIKGSTAPSVFKPYVAPITKTIPSEIKALDGYEYGVSNTCYNYIDFCNKKFVKKVIVTTNTTNFAYVDGYTKDNIEYAHFRLTVADSSLLPNNSTSNILSNFNFDAIGGAFSQKSGTWIGSANSVNVGWAFQLIMPVSIVGNTSNSIKAYFTANPLILYYELATPVQTDISSYLTNFNPILTNNNYTNYEVISHSGTALPNKISYFGTIKETLVEDITITNVGEQPQTIDLLDSDVSDGWSASASIFNYRDIRERKRHKVVGKYTFSNDSNITKITNASTPNGFYFAIDGIINSGTKNSDGVNIPNLLMADFTTVVNNVSLFGDMTLSKSSTTDRIALSINSNINTVESAKEILNGKTLYYELATEVIEDLDIPYDLHYLPLTSGGTVVFNNDNNQQCHNTIRYSIMEAKE